MAAMQLLFSKKKFPEITQARVGGELVSVAVKVSARARSYRLSIPHHGGPVLTVPSHGRWTEAEAFLNRQTAWLEARLKRAGKPVAFVGGAMVPLRGIDHVIVPTGKVRGRVELDLTAEIPTLLVPGEPEHQARRLIDWLKLEAQRDIEARCAIHSATLGVKVKSVSMRSQATRWGSCSSSGNLNFNWRLILAPPFVLDYVAAHEVAHLREMNHSQAFWDRVTEALPDMSKGRAWLKAHGRQLMAYGVDG
jgi:predicted metal-dependent hydrolase